MQVYTVYTLNEVQIPRGKWEKIHQESNIEVTFLVENLI